MNLQPHDLLDLLDPYLKRFPYGKRTERRIRRDVADFVAWCGERGQGDLFERFEQWSAERARGACKARLAAYRRSVACLVYFRASNGPIH